MEKEQTIGLSIVSAMLVSLMVLGGINISDDDVYYCEARDLIMQCDSFSRYYGLETGKCYNSDVGNKLCRSGWVKVIDDTEIEESHKTEPIIEPVHSSGTKWRCYKDKTCEVII